MADAVRRVGLEPLVLSASDLEVFRSIVYAYCSGGVPVLVIGTMWDRTDAENPRNMGVHAVTAAGFGLKPVPAARRARGAKNVVDISDVTWRSSRIDRLYCHDDQVGPFARMVFAPTKEGACSLSTSWLNKAGKMGSISMEPKTVMVPLYHKVRVRFPWILEHVAAFDKLLKTLQSLIPAKDAKGMGPLEWDIALATVDRVKREYFSGPAYPVRREVLERSLPRFLWRAQATLAGRKTLDILFDATDIERSNCCLCVIELDAAIGDVLRHLWTVDGLARDLLQQDAQWWHVVQRVTGIGTSHT
jgi:hypothetical protein